MIVLLLHQSYICNKNAFCYTFFYWKYSNNGESFKKRKCICILICNDLCNKQKADECNICLGPKIDIPAEMRIRNPRFGYANTECDLKDSSQSLGPIGSHLAGFRWTWVPTNIALHRIRGALTKIYIKFYERLCVSPGNERK